MTMADWLTITAIIAGPILAVQAQKWMEGLRESKLRKLAIFRTLMLTRDPFSRGLLEHVQALNQIDIEFYGWSFPRCNHRTKADKEIVSSWKKYLGHLNTMAQSRDANGIIPQVVISKSEDLLMELLDKMAKSLGYDFDEIDLRRGIYKPELFLNNALFTQSFQQSLKEILEGKKSISVTISNQEKLKNVE